MEYDQIEKDFVIRTLDILEEYSGKHQATLLINCCLGLLVLPREKHQISIPDTELPIEGTLWGLSRDSITVDCPSCGYVLSDLVRRIRNGICHFKVRTIPDGSGDIVKLEIRDRGQFRVELSLEELTKLTTSLANHVISD